jgi:hypothetical protein
MLSLRSYSRFYMALHPVVCAILLIADASNEVLKQTLKLALLRILRRWVFVGGYFNSSYEHVSTLVEGTIKFSKENPRACDVLCLPLLWLATSNGHLRPFAHCSITRQIITKLRRVLESCAPHLNFFADTTKLRNFERPLELRDSVRNRAKSCAKQISFAR